MPVFGHLLDWFAGGERRYMTLTHCMRHDWFWIVVTVLLDLAVALGYVVIAVHWWRNQRLLGDSPAKSALRNMKNIFVFCGLCGYIFIPVKMFWPAWRLYDGFLAVLAFYTWRYALRTRELTVVYGELGRSAQLARDLVESREESSRKSLFLNAISHDLKTPLNGLMLQAEFAEMQLGSDDNEPLRDALAEIKNCARTTASLLNSFLEIGRLDCSGDSVRVEQFDVSELIREVVHQARARAELKNLTLVADVPPGVSAVTDRFRLGRILSNLVDNAISYTHMGGVEVRAEAGADLIIHVLDTGEGIEPKHHELIFDDFYQVKNRERDSRKGFGLGLSMARRLARQLDGDLLVDSTPGRGSRFTVVIRGATAAGWPSSGWSERPGTATAAARAPRGG